MSALGGSHWGRIFYKVQTPAPMPTSGVVHSTLVAGAAVSPVSGNIEVRVVDTVEDTTGHHQFLYNVQPDTRAEFGTGSDYSWTYDGRWHCAEWHVDYATQSYHFYFDGAEVTSIAITNGAGNFVDSEIPAVFTSLSVGWNNYQTSTPGFVAWFDEIAVDRARPGRNAGRQPDGAELLRDAMAALRIWSRRVARRPLLAQRDDRFPGLLRRERRRA